MKDVQALLTKAMEKGIPLDQFKREFKKTIEGRWQPTTKTGEPNTGWRARVIYRTNIRMAYANAQRRRLERMKDTHPFWRWRLGSSKVHRPDHVMRDGMALRWDDPFWDSHFPPDGYGCNCEVEPVSRSEMRDLGKTAKDGNPYGLGLGTRLFWPVFFKNQGIVFWLKFAEKFGGPTVIGKYPDFSSEENQRRLLEALMSASQETAAIVPLGSEVELLQAAQGGSIETYERLLEYMDSAISKAVLGETLTTQIGDKGSYSASQIHNDVRMELTKADADLLSNTLNESLLAWLTEFHFPGANPPRIWRRIEEPFNAKAEAEKDKILSDMGFDPDEAYIQEKYGEGWRKRRGGLGMGDDGFAQAPGAEPPADQAQGIQGEADPALESLPLDAAGGTALQDEALSGIQITSMMQVLGEVQRGIHSRQTAYHALKAAFPKVPEERINGMLDGIEVKPAQPAPAPTPHKQPEPDASFAEFRPKGDAVDSITDRLESAAADAMDGLLEPVRRLVSGAASYEEVLEGLDSIYPELDDEAFQKVMGDALLAASLAGAVSVRRNVGR